MNKQNASRSSSTAPKSESSGFFNSLKTAIKANSFSTTASEEPETLEPETTSENKSLLSKYSQKLKSSVNAVNFINKSKNMVQGAHESMQHSLNFTKYLPYIILLCIAGAFFLFLAVMLAPAILLFPQKFSASFALGCLCFMTAIALVRGPQKFVMSLLEKEKLIFTITYFCALAGTFMFSKVVGSHFLSIIFAALQAISLLWLIAASIPGGKAVAGTVQSLVLRCCKATCKKMLGGSSSGGSGKSFLPI